MPTINNIPQAMIDEHVAWHSRPGNPAAGGRAIDPFPPFGRRPALRSGQEFLEWHEGYVDRFRQWVNTLQASEQPSAESISPWHAIPQMLKMSMLGWNTRLANEEQLLTDMSNFDSLDDLGRFLEWSLHGFLHNAASGMWNEQILLSYESPRSTFFWQLHGLIDHLRQRFVDNRQPLANPMLSPLQVNGPAIQGDIGGPGEIDRYIMNVSVAVNLTVETTGPSDVVLYIAGPDNPRRLHSSDDDSGRDFNARIAADFVPGTYFIFVVFYDRSQTGRYSISVAS